MGLYFKLNLSNRWNESWWACISRVSIDRSYADNLRESKTCSRVNSAPSRYMTTSCVRISATGRSQLEKTVYLWATFHFRLDEPKKMLLVHATRMMNMGVNLSHVVKISAVVAQIQSRNNNNERAPTDGAHAVGIKYQMSREMLVQVDLPSCPPTLGIRSTDYTL
jgi:hypothetical protein